MRAVDDLRGRTHYMRGKHFEDRRDGSERAERFGVRTHPPEPVTTLIAVRALVGGSAGTRKLVEKLHPEPEVADVSRLDDEIRELRKYAEHIATLVRGGLVDRGTPPRELPLWHHAVVERVMNLHEQGWPVAQITKDINNHERPWWEPELFTEDQIRRLIRTGYSPPE